MVCSKCGAIIGPADEYVKRGDVVLCGPCEWPDEPTPETKAEARAARPVDTTQGFTDGRHGPPYPTKDVRSIHTKGVAYTWGRCECGKWVNWAGDTDKRHLRGLVCVDDNHAKPCLFGRHWCRDCARGHAYAKGPSRLNVTGGVSLSAADSRHVREQIEREIGTNPENHKPSVFVAYSVKAARKAVSIRCLFRFADGVASMRLARLMRPADKQAFAAFMRKNFPPRCLPAWARSENSEK